MKKLICTTLAATLLFSAASASDTQFSLGTDTGSQINIVGTVGEMDPEIAAAMEALINQKASEPDSALQEHSNQLENQMSTLLPDFNMTVGDAIKYIAEQTDIIRPDMEDNSVSRTKKKELLRALMPYATAVTEVTGIPFPVLTEWQEKYDVYSYLIQKDPVEAWEAIRNNTVHFVYYEFIPSVQVTTVTGTTPHVKTALSQNDIDTMLDFISLARQTMHLETNPVDWNYYAFHILRFRIFAMPLENYHVIQEPLETFINESGIGATLLYGFSDMDGHWAYDYVTYMADEGYVKGTATPVYGTTTYNPEGTVTLGEFLTIATRMAAGQDVGTSPSGHWALSYFNKAIELGLFAEGDFSADALDTPVSREDMAYILIAVAQQCGKSMETTVDTNIPDFQSVSAHRKEAVSRAYAAGLLQGDEYGNFNPHNNLTRAEVATVFYRIITR